MITQETKGNRSIILITILNMVSGLLVAKGIVDAGSRMDFVNTTADFIGAAAYTITVGMGLYQFFKTHRHNITEQAQTDRLNITGANSTAQVPLPPLPANAVVSDTLFSRIRNFILTSSPETK